VAETREQIRDFLLADGGWTGSRDELTDELPLIENRVIDSMGLLRLVSWLEERYGVSIPDEEIVPANFGTIAGIDELVAAKRTGV
jgi:acyl carrier protein